MSGAASRDKRRARAGGRHARFADCWFASSGLVRLYSTVVLSLSVLGGHCEAGELGLVGCESFLLFFFWGHSGETMFRHNI